MIDQVIKGGFVRLLPSNYVNTVYICDKKKLEIDVLKKDFK